MIFSMKIVTPSTASVPQTRSIDIKTKESKLAAMDKRTFPLNCLQQSTIQIIRETNLKDAKAEKVPDFMSDFLKDTNKYHVRAKSCVNSFRTKNKPSERVREPQTNSTQAQGSRNNIPTVSYRMFKKTADSENERIYRPHVLNVSQRSKMTVYAAVPINLRPFEYKPKRLKSASKRKDNKMSLSVVSSEKDMFYATDYK